MRYIYLKQKNRIKSLKHNENIIFITKWIKKETSIQKYKTVLLYIINKKRLLNLISTTKFNKICHISWRSKNVILPFYLSKTTMRSLLSKNLLNNLKKF